MRRHAFLLACLALGFSLSTSAQDRTWSKFHHEVRLEGEIASRYTVISSSDRQSPHVSRLLYDDMKGGLLVVRRETTTVQDAGEGLRVTDSVIAISRVENDEALTVTLRGEHGTLRLAGGSVTFVDVEDDTFPKSVRDAATALLADTSQEFNSALRGLTEAGSYSSFRLASAGLLLRKLFYPDIDAGKFVVLDGTPTDAVVHTFNPTANPPGPFELQFGDAYYQ